MYGYFECSNCNIRWESANVHFKNKAARQYYGQQCKKCNTMYTPYRVEETTCSRCGMVARTCNCDKTRHTDPNKPHRADLCEKCRTGNRCQR